MPDNNKIKSDLWIWKCALYDTIQRSREDGPDGPRVTGVSVGVHVRFGPEAHGIILQPYKQPLKYTTSETDRLEQMVRGWISQSLDPGSCSSTTNTF